MSDITEQIKVHQALMADLGRQFPPEFIDGLAEDATATVRDWLTNNQAPAAVIDLLAEATMLDRCAIYAYSGVLGDLDAADLPEHVAEATHLIAACGGCFYSETGTITARPRAATA